MNRTDAQNEKSLTKNSKTSATWRANLTPKHKVERKKERQPIERMYKKKKRKRISDTARKARKKEKTQAEKDQFLADFKENN